MSSIFYRYIRPLCFNERRTEIETFPRGGICLRFERVGDGLLKFTHARCHEDELFSKGVAKIIADQRALQIAHIKNWPTVEECAETALLVEHVVNACVEWAPPAPETIGEQAVVKYMKLELYELASALEAMMHSNHQAGMRAEIWRLGYEAAGFADQYSGQAQ